VFGLAFGIGILGGAILSIILLEVRECVLRSASRRRSGLFDTLVAVSGNFAMLTEDIVQATESLMHGRDDIEQLRQDMKTRLRHGGGLDDAGDSAEMDSLYGEINPREV
jgi:hypothetical protein